ncbi:hypothetical protein ACX27O_23045 [Micromonospora sp. SD19]|uniref:hypothetical protein n=1 Tax=Micromonospora parva TaxID=1464048 RepID=UPI000B1B42EC|nr:hypothetical protein [Micromonospora parva]
MDTPATPPERTGRGRRRTGPVLAVVLLVVVVGGLVIGSAVGGADTGIFDGDPPRWASTFGAALCLLGLGVEIVAIVWAVRTGRYRANRRQSPLTTLSWSRRRRLGRQVRRGTPEPGEDPALLVETARQAIAQRWFVLVIAGLAMTGAGQAFLGFAPFHVVIGGLLVVIWAVLIVLVLRAARQGEAFLRAHPDLGGR